MHVPFVTCGSPFDDKRATSYRDRRIALEFAREFRARDRSAQKMRSLSWRRGTRVCRKAVCPRRALNESPGTSERQPANFAEAGDEPRLLDGEPPQGEVAEREVLRRLRPTRQVTRPPALDGVGGERMDLAEQ